MLKKIVAVVGAVVAATAWAGAGPAEALPACVASTGYGTCTIETGDAVELVGRAEFGSLTIFGAAGNIIEQFGWGTGLASLAATHEVFVSEPGGRAVLSIFGTGAAALTPAITP